MKRELLCTSVERGAPQLPHPVSLALPIAPRSHRGCVRSFELVRVTLVRFHSRAGSAGLDAFDRRLHSENT
jgi:hypothetical protein